MLMALLLATAVTADAEETFGCEANPTGDPVGGGEGYSRILDGGDVTATTAEGLVAALQQAQPGQVIYVPDGVEIDLTEYGTLAIPEGVTLAGSRGRDGSRVRRRRRCHHLLGPVHRPADGPAERPAASVLDLALTPDGRHLVSASQDTTLLVWEVP